MNPNELRSHSHILAASAYLKTGITVGTQEVLALGCDVIPFPFKQMNHSIASGNVVGVELCVGGGHQGQKAEETLGQKHAGVIGRNHNARLMPAKTIA